MYVFVIVDYLGLLSCWLDFYSSSTPIIAHMTMWAVEFSADWKLIPILSSFSNDVELEEHVSELRNWQVSRNHSFIDQQTKDSECSRQEERLVLITIRLINRNNNNTNNNYVCMYTLGHHRICNFFSSSSLQLKHIRVHLFVYIWAYLLRLLAVNSRANSRPKT